MIEVMKPGDLPTLPEGPAEVKITERSSKRGYVTDRDKLEQYKLQKETIYHTIGKPVQTSWGYYVTLAEVPDVRFSLANFEIVKPEL